MIAKVSGAELKDFLITIVLGAALAISYVLAIRAPARTAVARGLNRYHSFWSRLPFSVSARAQLWLLAIVFSLITIAALITLLVRLFAGQL